MSVQYTVLQLLDAAHGSLAEIALTDMDGAVGGDSIWLWIEGNWVTSLRILGEEQPSKRLFDLAVLTLDGTRGELRWPSGQCEDLRIKPNCVLRPAFQRLVHQHLN